ncbi:efflux RND transporter periplasmic adaptor subunit [Pseudothauera rhizosphaerae]|uniref:Efflux RND transporter periplasmic adaptor subunit n=1 Tax=Pseudothauera rhizosphaerae TaxID=2565932 RepID=A0A4S4APW3_9RHOO|nr:efflux RND transporter periplasmic adaptor subunit [Pseudothauera rhizosphaerae]THF61756.1 efflux RND transporter periplasmic adaptor subunit [Pseudothauera rhizosphaerae]
MNTSLPHAGAAALAVLLAACAPQQAEEAPPRAVRVVRPDAAGADALARVYTGEVRARLETDLAFRIGGKVISRQVDAGDGVRRGDLLARLDPADVRLAAGAAAAQVAAAEADLALARAELSRSEELHRRNFVSASALDARRTAVQAAEAALRAARAQAASAGNQAEYADLHADHDGVVLNTFVEPGAVVAAGQAVLRVARPEEREVLIHVPESRLAGLAVGLPAVVHPWAAAGRTFVAQVREITPVADAATRSFAVRVAVRQADDSLPLGATASVVLAGPEQAPALVPLGALTRVDGRPAVWVVDAESRVRPVPVEIGEYREGGALLRGGLPADARVVATGVHKLVEGESVRAVEDGEPVRLDARR